MTEVSKKVELLEPKMGIDIPYKLPKDYKVVTRVINYDNINFHTSTIPATGTCKGKILILHGWCEHCDMYYRIMQYLSSIGYESFVYDQRGSGRTSLGRYRGRVGRSSSVVYKDLDKMIEVFKFGDKKDRTVTKSEEKFYLLGHSAGGGIALNYMLDGKYKDLFTGIITTGPMIRIAENLTPSPIIEYALNFVATWFPYFPYGSINKDPNIRSTITTAEEWLDYLQQELLTQGNTTLGHIKSMFDRGYRLANISPEEINVNHDLRLLTIHCANDTMTSFKHSKKFFDKLPIKYKKFVEFEKGTHSLFIETDEIFKLTCEEIFEFLDDSN
ncbi:monoglyceride lipase [[Candida] jaroonii]|uniref:Monoglyceride lipase n=1 Tax=[Candida] jaroonii TaxID=467808 RepID=A0ACA9YGA5_9ASCO|nr:monoglyceride lipase [[Candida] jaroonii]